MVDLTKERRRHMDGRVLRVKVTRIECEVVDDTNGRGGVGAPPCALRTRSGLEGGPEFELAVPVDADRDAVKNALSRALMGGARVVVGPGAGRVVLE
jgi:hypothetical protein